MKAKNSKRGILNFMFINVLITYYSNYANYLHEFQLLIASKKRKLN